MTEKRRIYLLNPQELKPETIAVAFAKTSRSPKPFDAIAAELNDARSAQFHEKWVVGYGHSSVAEHAILHVALENVSRLAIETIEGNRLASYTEKSTRYQQWEGDAFYVPEELQDHPLRDEYVRVSHLLFETYQTCIPKVHTWLAETTPMEPGESEQAYQRKLHPAAVDICRFLLPAASLANVGMTINARALEYAICKMLSSPLEEVRTIGDCLREVSQDEVPTLVKYAKCNAYAVATREKMTQKAAGVEGSGVIGDLSLIDWDTGGENAVLAAVLFRFGAKLNFKDCLEYIGGLSKGEKEQFVRKLMSDRGIFDRPLREFEYAQMTFESVMDQGAYFEFKRHRMMTQTAQALTAGLGFAIPKGMIESGCGEVYQNAMRQAADLYYKLASWNPDVASYIVPNGFNRRVLFTMNLRQAFHFCNLRAAENAHFSIRRVAYQVAETIQQIYPLIGAYFDIPVDDSSLNILKQYFYSIAEN